MELSARTHLSSSCPAGPSHIRCSSERIRAFEMAGKTPASFPINLSTHTRSSQIIKQETHQEMRQRT